MKDDQKFTCPCCGYKVFSEFPGSWDICPICFWEDDPVQLLDPAYEGGANTLSLTESQKNFSTIGVSDNRFTDNVRPPNSDDERDVRWRPATQEDLKTKRVPADLSTEEFGKLEIWYYWLKNPS